MSTQYWETIIAALLHDVGKVGQRAFESGTGLSEQSKRMQGQLCPTSNKGYSTHLHVLYTNEFFNQIEKNLPVELDRSAIINAAVKHHKPEQNTLSNLLAIADRQASGMERIENDSSVESSIKKSFRETRLVSICSTIQLPGIQTSNSLDHKLAVWDTDASVLMPVKDGQDSLIVAYKSLWDTIITRFQQIRQKSAESFVAEALDVLEATTWCVPSATNVIPDISLFDHSRAVAAIAGCLIQVSPEESQPFLLVSGDFTGIQRYIYDIRHGSGAVAKTLRARSTLVGLFGDHVVFHLLKSVKCGLPHKILAAGGKMHLLLPKTIETEKIISESMKKIDEWSLKESDGELRYVIDTLPLDVDALKRFGSTLTIANQRLENLKRRPLAHALKDDSQWKENAFLLPQLKFSESEALCSSCGRRPGRPTEHNDATIYLCEQCLAVRKFGGLVPKQEAALLASDQMTDDIRFPFFNVRLAGPEGSKDNSGIVLHWKPIAATTKGISVFQRRATYVPMNGKEVVDFQELSQKAIGRSALAFIKADVDDLGLIFREGLNRQDETLTEEERLGRISLSRIATLSRSLEAFFGGFVENLITKQFPNIYLVYSGGDDLVAVGPWDCALKFIIELRKQFGIFTGGNPSFGFSAGVSVVGSRTPLLQAIENAESMLRRSKSFRRITSEGEKEKDALSVFDTTLDWLEMEKAIQQGEKLLQWLKSETLTVGKVRRLLGYGSMFENYRRDSKNTSNLKYITSLLYDLKRNWSERSQDEAQAKEWAQQLANPEFESLRGLRLACIYAIYGYRKS
jgi:CRISPR-associated protein Csm1